MVDLIDLAITVRSLDLNERSLAYWNIHNHDLPCCLAREKPLKSLIIFISIFYSREEVHAKIHLLLSLRCGVSPGAKEEGEVMWPSPPLSIAAPPPLL